MKIGSFVYTTQQGLGYLAKSFHDAGVVNSVMVISHGRHPNQDWYPGAPLITDLRNSQQQREMRNFCRHMDVMLFFETPFDWQVIPYCKSVGVKTVLMPMYECEHAILPAQPDAFLNPSLLDQQYYPSGAFIPVPVEYPWRQRTKAEVFVHNAGHGGLKGRNGTAEVLEAMEYIRSPAKLIIRSQSDIYRTADYRQQSQLTNPLTRRGQKYDYDIDPIEHPPLERMCDLRIGDCPYSELFSEGDVFLFPEKHNGLSLPLQESRAAGMLVMCGDRFPMNTWLSREPLIPVSHTVRERIGPPYNEFDSVQYDPKAIAAKVDEWYGRDITAYSESGREWAETMSWDVLKPRYMEFLESVMKGS